MSPTKKLVQGKFVYQKQTPHKNEPGTITDTVIVNPNATSSLLAIQVTRFDSPEHDRDWVMMHLVPRNGRSNALAATLHLDKIEPRGSARIGIATQQWLNHNIEHNLIRETNRLDGKENMLEFKFLGEMQQHGEVQQQAFNRLQNSDLLTPNAFVNNGIVEAVKAASQAPLDEAKLVELDGALSAQSKIKVIPHQHGFHPLSGN